MYTPSRIRAIYTHSYAEIYESLYLVPWPNKHRHNIANINRILSNLPIEGRRWLDVCCGQAWHFSQFFGATKKFGLDISLAQLHRAKRRNPNAAFIQCDALAPSFGDGLFDLVTSFWGAYCYLDNENFIGEFVDNTIAWTRPGGTVYLELLLPEMLQSFNDSAFAGKSQFRVVALTQDFRRWSYSDCGGEHLMTSPPLSFFLSRFNTLFRDVTVEYDNGFMHHFVASGKVDSTAEHPVS
jgi:hypothetical protein